MADGDSESIKPRYENTSPVVWFGILACIKERPKKETEIVKIQIKNQRFGRAIDSFRYWNMVESWW